MAPYRDLNVLDAADLVADQINQLIEHTPALLHASQLRRSSQSIGANISEGFGRGAGRERAYFLRTARGSAEETIRHLRANQGAHKIEPRDYWSARNRLVAISRMLDRLLAVTDDCSSAL